MNEMREPLLQIENLSTHFHMFKGTVKAVDGVSFSLNQGEILGVVGESGSGKSVTSFSIIGLVDEPGEVKADKIIFDGKDLTALSEQDMMKIRGKDISMIFQDPMTSLNPLYTIGKQLEEVLLLHDKQMSKEARHARCVELLKMVGVPNAEERLKAYPHQFSGGMRQRVIIAIALAANPKLVIADEPTTALDVTIQAQILRLMKQLVRGPMRVPGGDAPTPGNVLKYFAPHLANTPGDAPTVSLLSVLLSSLFSLTLFYSKQLLALKPMLLSMQIILLIFSLRFSGSC